MKTFVIVFGSFTLMAIATVFAYNSDKGPAKQKEGISELPQPATDSIIKRGKELVSKMNYDDKDLQAISVYLKSR